MAPTFAYIATDCAEGESLRAYRAENLPPRRPTLRAYLRHALRAIGAVAHVRGTF